MQASPASIMEAGLAISPLMLSAGRGVGGVDYLSRSVLARAACAAASRATGTRNGEQLT